VIVPRRFHEPSSGARRCAPVEPRAKLEAGTIGCAPAMTFALAGADAFGAASLARGRSCVDPTERVKLVAVTTG